MLRGDIFTLMPPQMRRMGRLCSLIDLNWPTCSSFLSSGHCGFLRSELRMHSVQNKWPQGVSEDWSRHHTKANRAHEVVGHVLGLQ